jgi:hypothetical protein
MIGLFALFRRKRADATAESAPHDDQPRQQEARKAAWLMGGGYEKTQDLLAGHDGERVGFRKPVQG